MNIVNARGIPWAVRLSWLENASSRPHFFPWAILTNKVGRGDIVYWDGMRVH